MNNREMTARELLYAVAYYGSIIAVTFGIWYYLGLTE